MNYFNPKNKNVNPLWDNDLIQFARLICEIEATEGISLDVAASMDLSESDLNELVDRANLVWENAKAANVGKRD